MKHQKIILTIAFAAAALALGEGVYINYLKVNTPLAVTEVAPLRGIATTTVQQANTCPLVRAPDGTMVKICPVSIEMPLIQNIPDQIISTRTPTLLSVGTGTTTFKKETPLNDILVAETGSQYGLLRNARYNMWPYPNEVLFKEIYVVLPEAYEPIFSGYSNHQFIVSSDGVKHVMLYLRSKQSGDVGADARVYIQSPVTTDESDHALTLVESNQGGAVYSKVVNGREVIVEVTFTVPSGGTALQFSAIHAELLRAVSSMEISW